MPWLWPLVDGVGAFDKVLRRAMLEVLRAVPGANRCLPFVRLFHALSLCGMILKAQPILFLGGRAGRPFDAGPVLPWRAGRAEVQACLEPNELLLAPSASFLIACLRLVALCLHPPEPWQGAGLERFWNLHTCGWRGSCVCRIVCLPPPRASARRAPVCRSSAQLSRCEPARAPRSSSHLAWRT